MTRYQGTITKINRNAGYAWISRKTVCFKSGEPADLQTGKDIIIYPKDCDFEYEVDMIVRFELTNDSTRAHAYRALVANAVSKNGVADFSRHGIDLHIDNTAIEHPSVPMRWCFSATMHAHVVAGLREGKGYAVLLRARKARDDEYGYHEIREIKGWNQPFSIVGFSRPGDWIVDIILFERENQSDGEDTSNALKLALRNRLLVIHKGLVSKYERFIPTPADIGLSGHHSRRLKVSESGYTGFGVAISTTSLKVSVPRDIFAKEPSPAVKAYLNYFSKTTVVDECAIRGRWLWMIPGVVPWLLLEGFKRILNSLGAIIALLLAIKGSGKAFLYTFKPQVNFHQILSGYDSNLETTKNKYGAVVFQLTGPWNRPNGLWYTPLAIMIYALLAWLGFHLLLLVGTVAKGVFLALVSSKLPSGNYTNQIIFGMAVFALFFGFMRWRQHRKATADARWTRRRQARKNREKRQEQRTLAAATRQAVLAEQNAAALVCGDAPAAVTLTALPLSMQSPGMWFGAAKRQVCKPFGG